MAASGGAGDWKKARAAAPSDAFATAGSGWDRRRTHLAIWAIVFSPLAASKATLALKAASYVFLILNSIPYLLLRYGRLKIPLKHLSNFWGVAHQTRVIPRGFIP